jgi:transposase
LRLALNQGNSCALIGAAIFLIRQVRMSNRTGRKNYSEKLVLEAIKGTGGIVSQVAKRLGCDWSIAKKYINKWEKTKKAYDDEREAILDLAESAVYKAIKEGNTQDAKWVLATIGKKRGFSEKHEVEHSGAVQIIDDVPGKTDG